MLLFLVLAATVAIPLGLDLYMPVPEEMTLDEASSHVNLDPTTISHALASYVRSILAGDSPFDRFVNGHRGALSSGQQAGLQLFRGKANCTACHVGPTFTDERFHNTGVAWKRLRPLPSAEARGSSERGCRLRKASASLAVARYCRQRAEAEGPRALKKAARWLTPGDSLLRETKPIAARSRRPLCARSRAPRPTCTTAAFLPSKQSSTSTMLGAARTQTSILRFTRFISRPGRNRPWLYF